MDGEQSNEQEELEAIFADVPENVRSLITNIGLLPDGIMEDAEQIYGPFREGKCMTCHGPLGDTTLLLVNKYGIVSGYCGGPCMQDLAVMGFLQEVHDDISDKIKFRGGVGDGGSPEG